VFFHGESDFQDYLVVLNGAIFDMAAGLYDLKPPHVPERLVRPSDGRPDRIVDALFRCPRDFDDFIHVIVLHKALHARLLTVPLVYG
jgi:hypothetical protein